MYWLYYNLSGIKSGLYIYACYIYKFFLHRNFIGDFRTRGIEFDTRSLQLPDRYLAIDILLYGEPLQRCCIVVPYYVIVIGVMTGYDKTGNEKILGTNFSSILCFYCHIDKKNQSFGVGDYFIVSNLPRSDITQHIFKSIYPTKFLFP